jgi:hypothetical protein
MPEKEMLAIVNLLLNASRDQQVSDFSEVQFGIDNDYGLAR